MALTHLVLIAACLSILLPVLWTARSSFATKRVVYDPGNIFFSPTLENYTTIFRDDAFLKYFWNSLWIGVASALVSLAIGSLAVRVAGTVTETSGRRQGGSRSDND